MPTRWTEDGRGDKGRAREWLARAVRAPSDPMWVIDGAASPYWTPISPVTGPQPALMPSRNMMMTTAMMVAMMAEARNSLRVA